MNNIVLSQPKADIVIAVCCAIVIAIGRAEVLWFIVPGAAAQNTAFKLTGEPKKSLADYRVVCEKITLRNP